MVISFGKIGKKKKLKTSPTQARQKWSTDRLRRLPARFGTVIKTIQWKTKELTQGSKAVFNFTELGPTSSLDVPALGSQHLFLAASLTDEKRPLSVCERGAILVLC